MITQTQTAKKGETRAALKQAAGAEDAPDVDVEKIAEKREKKTEGAMTLDANPFLDGPEAAQLGVPLLKQSVARLKASAAKADQTDDSAPKDAPTPEN